MSMTSKYTNLDGFEDSRFIYESDIDWEAERVEADEQAAHDASERGVWEEMKAHTQRLWNER